MAKQSIPQTIQTQVTAIVKKFNAEEIKNPNNFYYPRFKGHYVYLDRGSSERKEPICRLKYLGKMNSWEFAIYKYSSEQYDPEEWFFPGVEFVNGTIEGALKAGMEAYPPSNFDVSNILNSFSKLLFRK